MLFDDFRYAFRSLLKTPSFTAVCVLTLALGIGANTAIFSVLNAFLLRPLPVQDPGNLYVLSSKHESNQDAHGSSYLDAQDYRGLTNVFADIAGYRLNFIGLGASGRSAERITVSYVTGNYFEMLGIQPMLGRLIQPSEGVTPSADPVIVLGYSYWKGHLGGDRAVVGSTVQVNGQPFTVIGVTPEGFRGTYALTDMEAYLPYAMITTQEPDAVKKRDDHGMHTLARLQPGVSVEQAQLAVSVLDKQLEQQYPETNKTVTHRVIPERFARPEENGGEQLPGVAAIFMVLVGLVLLVACVNVTNLLMVRATIRQKEIAVRLALGAGRGKLIRQLLVESLVLAALGGVAGMLAGIWLGALLGSIRLPGDLPIAFDFGFDWRVFSFSMVVVTGAGLVAGIMPAMRASRAELAETLRDGGRSNTQGAGRHRLRSLLVIGQVSVSLVLLIAAGLFVRSVRNIENMDLGFNAHGVMNISTDPSQQGYDETRGRAFYNELERRVQALPGVERASLAYSVPMGYYNDGGYVQAEGQELPPGDQGNLAGNNSVGADYFATLKIAIVKGRAFDAKDDAAAPPVGIVNEFMAQKLWPDREALGQRFSYTGPKGPWVEVVGVTHNLKTGFLFDDTRPYFYVPIEQHYTSLRVLHVRSGLPTQALATTLRREVAALDPTLPVFDVGTFDEALGGGNGFFLPRMGAAFAGALGVLGLVLAIIGVYGVVSYSASQRTHEIGIRMALGARNSQIRGMVLSRGLVLAGVGVVVGLVAAFALSRVLSNLLFGVSASDPITFGGASLVLALAALAASFIPARRAAKLDPLVALRQE